MNPMQYATNRPNAFALTDAAVTVAAVAMLGALALPVLDAFRTDARLAGSVSNLRTLGKANAAYGAANDGMISGFDWGFKDVEPVGGPFGLYKCDLGNGRTVTVDTLLELSQAQFPAILRRMTGRFEGDESRILFSTARVPHRRYSHLPLLDWYGGSASDPRAVAPLDIHLQEFQTDPLNYPKLPGGDLDATAKDTWTFNQVVNRWPYASSYQTTTYAWSPSTPLEFTPYAMPIEPGPEGTLLQVNDQNAFAVQPSANVSFPALKAHMFEEFDYSQGLGVNGMFFADPAASVNVLFFDGSARLVATADANPGWDPGNVCDQDATRDLAYVPIDSRYFPDYSGTALPQPYRWTRGGLEGIDVGAGEINTENWCE